MKKFLCLICALGILLLFAGCKPAEPTPGTDVPTVPPTDQKEEQTVDYTGLLKEISAYIQNAENEEDAPDNMLGIWEAALALGNNAAREIGYQLQDLNGDGKDELMIGLSDKEEYAYTKNEIYAVYTIKGDAPELVLAGRSRNAYALKTDGSFFYHGSNGAAFSIFGEYEVSSEGTLVCRKYFFTYPDETDPMLVDVYSNTTGEWDVETSEKLAMTTDALWEMEEASAAQTAKIDFIPFSSLNDGAEAPEDSSVPSFMQLAGDWIFVHGETDGYAFTAEESGITSAIHVEKQGDELNVYYWTMTEFDEQSFDAKLALLEEPLYYNCGNDEWSAGFVYTQTDFDESDEFYVTLLDENTLLLQHFFPFDGTQGVSYQTYERLISAE